MGKGMVTGGEGKSMFYRGGVGVGGGQTDRQAAEMGRVRLKKQSTPLVV